MLEIMRHWLVGKEFFSKKKNVCLLKLISIFNSLPGVWSQKTGERATVSVSQTVIEAKRGENISLECYGSNPDLGYYIGNRYAVLFFCAPVMKWQKLI